MATQSTGPSSSSTYSVLPKSSDGCVICPEVGDCPACAEDEFCMLTSLTCISCPTTYCAKKSSSVVDSSAQNGTTNGASEYSESNGSENSGLSNKQVGGIVGGVVGGVMVVLLISLWLLYQKYWKSRRVQHELDSKDALLFEDSSDEGDIDAEDEDSHYRDESRDVIVELPFTRPANRHYRPASEYSGSQASSNLLPIAYIPGVTTAKVTPLPPQPILRREQGRAHPADTISHITLGSSLLDDDASLQVPRMTTAYRPSQPRLVSVQNQDTTSTQSTILDLECAPSIIQDNISLESNESRSKDKSGNSDPFADANEINHLEAD